MMKGYWEQVEEDKRGGTSQPRYGWKTAAVLVIVVLSDQWRERGRQVRAVAPGRGRQGCAKQPHQKYLMIIHHKSEFDIVS